MMLFAKKLISVAKPLVDRFPRISAIYRSVRDQLDVMEEPVVTPWGFKLAGNAAMAQGLFEPAETELVRNILKDVDVLVNVGANIGYYCCHALSMGKTVIAFEPIPRNFYYLCKNIKANGWSGAEVYPIALSNNIDILEMYGGNTGASVLKGWAGASERYVTLVPSSTMDLMLGTRIRGKKALILIDVEGAEKQVLDGANIMLTSEPKPIWMVEITSKHNQPNGIDINLNFRSTFQLFFQNGYKANSVDQDMSPLTMKDVDLASKGVLKLATYNFLFR